MCDPATIALIAGTGLSAFGAAAQGQAADSAAQYNATIARQNAVLARQRAAEQERRFRIRSSKLLGSMRAAYGAAGVSVEGSPTAVLTESLYTAELDALTIRAGGRAEETTFERSARLGELQGQTQAQGAYLSAASELLGGVSSYYSMKRT